MKLYHACAAEDVDAILTEGLRAGSYLTNSEDIAGYYAETIEDEGKDACIIELEMDALLTAVGESSMEVDDPSVAEPLSYVLKTSDAAIWTEWEASGGTWRDSLAIVGSIRVSAVVPATLLSRWEMPTLS